MAEVVAVAVVVVVVAAAAAAVVVVLKALAAYEKVAEVVRTDNEDMEENQ